MQIKGLTLAWPSQLTLIFMGCSTVITLFMVDLVMNQLHVYTRSSSVGFGIGLAAVFLWLNSIKGNEFRSLSWSGRLLMFAMCLVGGIVGTLFTYAISYISH